MWETGVRLVQDEDSSVRVRGGVFGKGKRMNPHCVLEWLLGEGVAEVLPTEDVLSSLWAALSPSSAELASLDYPLQPTLANPYDLGVSNIYQERVKIVDMASASLLAIINR